ncbi:hypothetical protein ASPZODRAFT_168743 [Penicilliopsis zonata CBS 506.65]|uniref:Ricin B lectin domain-containing protein n=1 Tax=Penicilliopsis zonata CBS 506.65 TaxID=1073090 RepID=A0A1L9SBI5_9EURO|nr:hypothetical protein ASPZODRAFT_168743 [Penicilliopsis zonata CBS 506.65]OJJ44479.1 hypothetical protein ASPZODRAFT_168743 [Penicilliopsis zonata CBS 506.65]
MPDNPFNSKYYYRFSNSGLGSNYTLSLGLKTDPPATPSMTTMGAYSSENWQIFYDDGVYFLRNYDWGDTYQMGLTAEDTIPEMLTPDAALGMQWNISDGSTTGTYILRNMLIGSTNVLSTEALSDGLIVPIMNTDETDDELWEIDINVSAGTITNDTMLSTYTSLQAATTTSKSTSTSTSTTLATTTATATTAATAITATTNTTSSKGLSGGDIAGIAVGSAAGVIILAALAFFFYRARQRQPAQTVQTQTVRAELAETSPKSELLGNEANWRVSELPGE